MNIFLTTGVQESDAGAGGRGAGRRIRQAEDRGYQTMYLEVSVVNTRNKTAIWLLSDILINVDPEIQRMMFLR